MAQPGRNESCPCGSGRKYKHCCALKGTSALSSRVVMALIAGVILLALIAVASNSTRDTQPRGVWSPEHGHYHDANGREVR